MSKISSIKSKHLDLSSDDFASPIVFKKNNRPTKTKVLKQTVSSTKKRNKIKNQPTLQEVLNEQCKQSNSDVNPEHLQLALALSASLSQQTEDHNNSEGKEKVATLLQFGFKTDKKKINVINRTTNIQVPSRRNKKSKYRFITPILYLRTEEERNSLIQSKISMILSKDIIEPNENFEKNIVIFSETLSQIGNNKIFDLNNKLDGNNEIFIVPSLNIPINRSKCGYLLRDWSKIPFRDFSPEKVICSTQNSDNKNEIDSPKIKEVPHEKEKKRSEIVCSPDLFENCDVELNRSSCKKNLVEIFSMQPSERCLIEKMESSNEKSTTECARKSETHSNSKNSEIQEENDSLRIFLETVDKMDISDGNELETDKNSGKIRNLTSKNNSREHSSIFSELFKKKSESNEIPVEILLNDDENGEEDLNSAENILINNGYSEERIENFEIRENEFGKTDDSDEELPRFTQKTEKSKENIEEILVISSSEDETEESPGRNISNSINKVKENADLHENSFSFSDDIPNFPQNSIEKSHGFNDFSRQSIEVHTENSRDERKSELFSRENSNLTSNLNITEHIEEILTGNYSRINSLTLISIDDKSSRIQGKSINSDEKENCNKTSVTPSREHYIVETSGNKNPLMSSSDEISSMPSSDEILTISDEELNYSCSNKLTQDNGKSKLFRKFSSFTENSPSNRIILNRNNKSETCISTPKRRIIIKTENITPMLKYESLSTPEIVKELDKVGVKPLKRKRGIALLKHLYEVTHPKVVLNEELDRKTVKKRKVENDAVEFHNCIPENELIFERQRSKKISTCQVPLQIVWHNFLEENPEIKENILLYEPLQIEVIHKMLKDLGFKFHSEDLITFFDQKCITIRVGLNAK